MKLHAYVMFITLHVHVHSMYPLSTPDTGHKLTELYIRRNQLSDFSELDHLTSLPNLTVSV